MAKGRSARGVEVNFDALKIKEQLVERPAPVEVQAREDFVDQRLKRRARRKAQEAAKAAKLSAEAGSDVVALDDINPDELLDAQDADNSVDDGEDLSITTTQPKQRAPKKKA